MIYIHEALIREAQLGDDDQPAEIIACWVIQLATAQAETFQNRVRFFGTTSAFSADISRQWQARPSDDPTVFHHTCPPPTRQAVGRQCHIVFVRADDDHLVAIVGYLEAMAQRSLNPKRRQSTCILPLPRDVRSGQLGDASEQQRNHA